MTVALGLLAGAALMVVAAIAGSKNALWIPAILLIAAAAANALL